jgi:putative tryptophan/tyrosine transport system substrate-binding protein
MNRRAFVTGLGAVLAAPRAAEAQQAARVWRIGYLAAGDGSENLTYLNAFRQGLRELGYVEGRSIAIEYRWGEGKYERLPKLVAELVQSHVDVIVAANAPSAQAAKEATTRTPIVMTVLVDPAATGLVASLARPGGNVTGLSMMAPELAGKHLELLREVVPKISQVAVLGNPANPGTVAQLREAKAAAQALGLQLHVVEARGPSELDRAFAAMTSAHAEAVLVLVDAMFGSQREKIANLAIKSRLPAVSGLTRHAEAGDLLAYGASRVEVYRRAATYVDKILKGAKPADLPIERPSKFELVINLKTAKALGLTIPPSLLARADQVIE